jgi:hypothetical protein
LPWIDIDRELVEKERLTLKEENTISKLRPYNAAMGVIHLIQAVLMIILSNDLSLPVTSSFLNYLPDIDRLKPVTQTLFDVRIGYALAAFLLLSALAHLTVSSPRIFGWYARNLKNKINYARWFEYALSASLMIVVIAMLSGVYDIVSLLGLFILTALMNLFGLLMEQQKWDTGKINWSPFYLGCVAGIVPWIGIAIYFFGSASTGKMPLFVYFIMVSIFVLFFSFALNMFLQYKKWGPWRDYLFGERVYILLSLVAKSALAWQVFFGTLTRSVY